MRADANEERAVGHIGEDRSSGGSSGIQQPGLHRVVEGPVSRRFYDDYQPGEDVITHLAAERQMTPYEYIQRIIEEH